MANRIRERCGLLSQCDLQESDVYDFIPESVIASLKKFQSSNTDAEERYKEHKFLLKFQASKRAWEIILHILTNKKLYDNNACVFSAQTLRVKTGRDIEQLPKEQRTLIRDSILLMFDIYSGNFQITKQLCLSISNLAVVMDYWENPVMDVINVLHRNTALWPSLVEFLRIFCEENSEERTFNPSSDNGFNGRIIDEKGSNQVLDLLSFYYTQNSCLEEVLSCLSVWISSGNIKVSNVIRNKIFSSMLEHLSNVELQEEVSDCIMEIITNSYDPTENNRESVDYLFPILNMIKEVLLQMDDSISLSCLTRIYAEAGESWLDFLVEEGNTFSCIAEVTLECCTALDPEYMERTFSMWYSLTERIGLLAPEHSARTVYDHIIRKLVEVLMVSLRFPEDFSSRTGEECDDFRDFRYDVGSILRACVPAIGESSFLSIVCKPINQYLQLVDCKQMADNWRDVNAALFCLRVVHNKIANYDFRSLRDIMENHFKFPNHDEIKKEIILLIGCYSKWVARNPEYIFRFLQLMDQGFNNRSCVSTTSQSLKSLLKECSIHLIPHINQLYTFYLEKIPTLGYRDARNITEGIIHVLCALPEESLCEYFKMFTYPFIQKLRQFCEQNSSENSEKNNQTLVEIEKCARCLNIYFKMVKSRVVVPVVLEYWGVILATINIYALDVLVAEAFSCIISSMIRTYDYSLSFIIEDIMNCIMTQFMTRENSCWLYSAKSIIQTFGQNGTEQGENIFRLVSNLISAFFTYFARVHCDLESLYYAIEDFFLLTREVARRMPELFFNSELFPCVLSVSLKCLEIKNKQALKMNISFLDTVFVETLEKDENDKMNFKLFLLKILESVPCPLGDISFTGLLFEELISRLSYGLMFLYPSNNTINNTISDIINTLGRILSPQRILDFTEKCMKEKEWVSLSHKAKVSFLKSVKDDLERNPHGLAQWRASNSRV